MSQAVRGGSSRAAVLAAGVLLLLLGLASLAVGVLLVIEAATTLLALFGVLVEFLIGIPAVLSGARVLALRRSGRRLGTSVSYFFVLAGGLVFLVRGFDPVGIAALIEAAVALIVIFVLRGAGAVFARSTAFRDEERPEAPAARPGQSPLVRLIGVKKHFPITRGILFQRRIGQVHAVDGVDLEVYPGETVGLVGETGCGKSTTARLVTKLLDATEGRIILDGQDITGLDEREMREVRREIAIIFQDPYASLNPRKTVGSIIGEPMRIHGILHQDLDNPAIRFPIWLLSLYALALLGRVLIDLFDLSLLQAFAPFLVGLGALLVRVVSLQPARNRFNQAVKREVQRLMELVGLNPEHYNRFPHEFSGGQRQRIGVARSLTLRPKLIVCDEPVSALDVSIQAQILNLLEDLQEEFNLTYIFIAHDLSVVKHMSDRVAVMYLGRVVEVATGDTLYTNPKHPYTGALLSAVPIPDPVLAASKKRIVLEGDVPSPIDPPSGCRFHPRCPRAQFPVCREQDPALTPHHDGQVAACHFPLEDRAVIESTA